MDESQLCINGESSEVRVMSCRVRQGLVLGQLLFILYTKPVTCTKILHDHDMDLNADDTLHYFSLKCEFEFYTNFENLRLTDFFLELYFLLLVLGVCLLHFVICLP